MLFRDRVDAGRHLAPRLIHLRGSDPVVVGLPRGGVPVAFEVPNLLHAPFDVDVVRKLGTPYRPELAMGPSARHRHLRRRPWRRAWDRVPIRGVQQPIGARDVKVPSPGRLP